MEKESTIKFPDDYQKLASAEEENGTGRKNKVQLKRWLSFSVLAVLMLHSVISIWCLKTELNLLRKKVILLELKAEVDIQILKDLPSQIFSQLENEGVDRSVNDDGFGSDFERMMMEDDDTPGASEETDDVPEDGNEDVGDGEDDNVNDKGVKKKREIRDYNESSAEKDSKAKNLTEEKLSSEKSSGERSSTETEKFSPEMFSREKFFSVEDFPPSTRKPHFRRKHRKSRIGSAERFFTETHSTTTTPIQVRQSRTKLTQLHGIHKNLLLENRKLQQHTSPLKDTITKEEALKKGYGKLLEGVGCEPETSGNHPPDAVSYNMIMIHFSADTSHYSTDRDSHYFGNGRMQIKSEVYKDWKPAHWTQGVGMSKYFHLHQGRVTVSTTGIYLIYAQIQYSNVQEVNGFSVFRNNEVVVQCITTSTHPDKHEIKSNTCGISTTILLQSNDSVCIKDLHHGRYVVLTPEKSYFGLVLLSPFKS